MHQLRRLGPPALLVSGLLLALSGSPGPETVALALTLAAMGAVLLLAWRFGSASWLRTATPTPAPASRVTIRLRCRR